MTGSLGAQRRGPQGCDAVKNKSSLPEPEAPCSAACIQRSYSTFLLTFRCGFGCVTRVFKSAYPAPYVFLSIVREKDAFSKAPINSSLAACDAKFYVYAASSSVSIAFVISFFWTFENPPFLKKLKFGGTRPQLCRTRPWTIVYWTRAGHLWFLPQTDRQHTGAYVSIRFHTSAYVCVRLLMSQLTFADLLFLSFGRIHASDLCRHVWCAEATFLETNKEYRSGNSLFDFRSMLARISFCILYMHTETVLRQNRAQPEEGSRLRQGRPRSQVHAFESIYVCVCVCVCVCMCMCVCVCIYMMHQKDATCSHCSCSSMHML